MIWEVGGEIRQLWASFETPVDVNFSGLSPSLN